MTTAQHIAILIRDCDRQFEVVGFNCPLVCIECNNTGRQPDSPYPCAFCAPPSVADYGMAESYKRGTGFGTYYGD